MRGGLTIQKLDSETGTTPQGDASLEGNFFSKSSTTLKIPWW